MPKNQPRFFTSGKTPTHFKNRYRQLFGKVKPTLKKPIQLIKSIHNPILAPHKANNWESFQVFNPGVIYLDKKVQFVYRAQGTDGVSRLGYASSTDGFMVNERHPHPIYEHSKSDLPFTYYSSASGGSWGGAEDPRLVRVGEEEKLFMTYTATEGGLRMALTSIDLEDFRKHRWNWKIPKLISPPGEIHKNWVLFPEKINGRYALLTSISPEIQVSYLDSLEFEDNQFIESSYSNIDRDDRWDSWVRGAGPPPIKTSEGWLLFYHGMDKNDPGKYKVGVLLLNLEDPTVVIKRAEEAVLEPSEYYENNGFKCGVVYASGAIVKSGEILVYYGGSDSYVCVAHTNLDHFLRQLLTGQKTKWVKQLVKNVYV